LNTTSLDLDLDRIRDEVKLLRLRIKAIAVHKDMLLKQLSEAMKFEQELHEELNRQFEKEKKLNREMVDRILQLSEVYVDGETTQHISFSSDNKLLSEESNDGRHNHILHLENKELVVTNQSTKWHDSVLPATEHVPGGEASIVDNVVQNLKYSRAPYICPICNRTFTIEKYLRRHVRMRCCQTSYICPMCNKTFKTRGSLRKHTRTRYCQALYICPLCKRTFSRRNNLHRHIQKRSCEREKKKIMCERLPDKSNFVYACGVCKNAIENETSERSSLDTSEDICKACEIIYPDLSRAGNAEDQKERIYLCTVCNAKFVNRLKLLIHARLSHASSYRPKLDSFTCGICHNTTDNSTSDQRGPDNHKDICSACEKVFPDLFQSMNDSDVKFSCTKCNVQYSERSKLVKHARKHLAKRPHVCHLCGKSFLKKQGLDYHIKTHGDRKLLPVVTNQSSKWHDSVLPTTEHVPGREVFIVDNIVQNLKSSRAPYICPICNRTFTIEKYLRRHVRMRCCQASYICLMCNRTFKTRGSLRKHTRTRYCQALYICPLCKRTFSNGSGLHRHIRKRSCETEKNQIMCVKQPDKSNFVYACGVCKNAIENETSERSSLNTGKDICKACEIIYPDLSRAGNAEDQIDIMYLCTVCNAKFVNRLKLLIHARLSHASNYPPKLHSFTCGICHNTTDNSTSDQRGPDNNKDICSACEKVFPDLFQSVNDSDETLKKFSCTKCNFQYLERSKLVKHAQKHFAERPYVCHLCEKSFQKQFGLECHIKIHGDRKLLQCNVCSKKVQTKRSLECHMVLHSGVMNYTCAVCGKSFACKDGLKYHTRTHTGERPYACPRCPKTFVMLCHLKTHATSHTGEKPLECTVCSKRFRLHCARKRHMKIHARKGEFGSQTRSSEITK